MNGIKQHKIMQTTIKVLALRMLFILASCKKRRYLTSAFTLQLAQYKGFLFEDLKIPRLRSGLQHAVILSEVGRKSNQGCCHP